MTYYLDTDKLSSLVRSKRGNKGLRDAAKDIGNISPSTLSRVENGKMPDMENFLAICDWLSVPPAELIKNTEDKQDLDIPKAIALLIQSDNNLDPNTANALSLIIKATYKYLSEGDRL